MNKNLDELRAKALTETNVDEMLKLSVNPDMCVRRNLAFNRKLPKSIVKLLANDVAENVSYIVYKIHNYSISNIDWSSKTIEKCVSCLKTDYKECSYC